MFLVLTLCGVCCAWLVAPDWGELHCRATRNLKVNTMTPWRRNTHRNIRGTQDSREHQGSGSRASHSNLPATCINLVCITTRRKIGAIERRDPRCSVLWWCDGATLRCKNCTAESNGSHLFYSMTNNAFLVSMKYKENLHLFVSLEQSLKEF